MLNSSALRALWRLIFYTLAPKKPFLMRTAHYKFYAYPTKPNLSRAVIRRGTWERCITEIFVHLIRPGDFFVDIGANFGHFSLISTNIVGPGGFVLCFDPQPRVFDRLTVNFELQPHQNFRLERLGIGVDRHTATLITDGEASGGHSLVEEKWQREIGGIEVEVISLDDYLTESGPARPVSVLKIDVEGAELDALKGARRVLETDRPIILTELTVRGAAGAAFRWQDVLAVFAPMNYAAIVIQDGRGIRQWVPFDRLAEYVEATGADYVDLCLIPAERCEALRPTLDPLMS